MSAHVSVCSSDPGPVGVKTGIEFDLSAVDPKYFIYEIARQAFEQGMNAGIKHKTNQIRATLGMEPLKE